ncbi:glycosyltransferase family 2 protein [Lactobacillus amylovorus]|uniref:glycosyltransferase family 2 protein n=1 Tax=Lactobacillus amylovorus TaxID=1604 RepID=UPI001CCBCEDF|nr:glycosyltransferase family 2 protein [Lactobacillus amylovorus]
MLDVINKIMKKKLSIIIPIYNSEKYLIDCLNSVIQNLPDDFEVIIINDGSTDNSVNLVERFFKKFSNVYLYSQKNKGISSARNLGLEKANGDWIWFVDSDDIINSNIYKYLEKFLFNYYPDVFLFGYQCFSSSIPAFKDSFYYKKINKNKAMNTMLEDSYSTFLWNKIIKRKLFDNINFPESRNNLEDLSVIYKIYEKAHGFYISSLAFYGYRQHGSSITKTLSEENIIDAAIARYEMLEFFQNHSYTVNISKLRHETLVSIVSVMHRIKKDNNLFDKFSRFIYSIPLNKKLGFRYYLEVFSFKYCRPMFNIIGFIGEVHRKNNV